MVNPVTMCTHTGSDNTHTHTHIPPRLKPSLFCHGELHELPWHAAAPPGAQRALLAAGGIGKVMHSLVYTEELLVVQQDYTNTSPWPSL